MAKIPQFSEISSFFGLCGTPPPHCTTSHKLIPISNLVWLIPFALFVSLSAGENVLPSTSDIPSRHMDPSDKGKGKAAAKAGPGMVKMVVDSVRDGARSAGETFGWMGPGTSRGRFD